MKHITHNIKTVDDLFKFLTDEAEMDMIDAVAFIDRALASAARQTLIDGVVDFYFDSLNHQ